MSEITRNQSQKYGPLWELNPRPLAPKARIIPLDQTANTPLFNGSFTHNNEKTRFSLFHNYNSRLLQGISRFSLYTYFGSSLSLLLLMPSTSRTLNLLLDCVTIGLNSGIGGV